MKWYVTFLKDDFDPLNSPVDEESISSILFVRYYIFTWKYFSLIHLTLDVESELIKISNYSLTF